MNKKVLNIVRALVIALFALSIGFIVVACRSDGIPTEVLMEWELTKSLFPNEQVLLIDNVIRMLI